MRKVYEPTYEEEVYKVVIQRDIGTGFVVGEAWYKDKKFHRIGGPAQIGRDRYTGVVTDEAWFKDGELHRTDGPATIEYDAATGKPRRRQWYIEGKLIPSREVRRRHLPTGPAPPAGPR